MNQYNTYEVFADVMKDGKRWYKTSDRVVANSKDAAKAKIEKMYSDYKVTGVMLSHAGY